MPANKQLQQGPSGKIPSHARTPDNKEKLPALFLNLHLSLDPHLDTDSFKGKIVFRERLRTVSASNPSYSTTAGPEVLMREELAADLSIRKSSVCDS